MSISLELRQKLNTVLSPGMLLLRSVLHMNAPELEQYVHDAALENPLLKVEDAPFPASGALRAVRERTRRNGEAVTSAAGEFTDPFLFIAAPRSADVQTYLHAVVDLMPLEEQTGQALSVLISYIERNGRLETSLEQIARASGIPENELAAALSLLQHIDPVGIGARSLSECLLLQLEEESPEDLLAQALVRDHLPELSAGKFAALAKALRVSQAEIEARFSRIKALDPFPAAAFEAHPAAQYVQEDLIAREENGRFAVRLRDDLAARISLDPQYVSLIPTTAGDDQKWLIRRRQEALQLREHIVTRNQLLLVCAHYLLEHQPEYARDRTSPLRPLTLSQASAELGLHLSVLSRLISEKYIRIDSELVPMRSFFSRELSTDDSGVTPSLVKQQLRRILQSESPTRPYTDQQLCQALEAQGFRLSRRTVAKYRSELGIPPAGGRKNR